MTSLTSNNTHKTVRGFALYIGFGDDALDAHDPQLKNIIEQLRARLTELHPSAESYAALALAPENINGKNLDLVRVALNEPAAKKEQSPAASAKRATGVIIDFSRRQVLLDGYDANLSYREFKLIKFLVLREGLTVTRGQLTEGVWGAEADIDANSRATDVQIRRLRAKLGDYHKIISTVRGKGYRFDRHADVKILHGHAPSPDRV